MANRDRCQEPGRVDPDDVVGFVVADPYGAVADRDPGRAGVRIELLRLCCSQRVYARQQARGGRNPDRVALRRDRPRRVRVDVADRHGGAEPVELGVDPADEHAAGVRGRIQIRLDHPHTAGARRDPRGRTSDWNLRQRVQGPGVNPCDRLIVEVGHPQRSRTERDRAGSGTYRSHTDHAIAVRVDRGQ